MRPLSGGQDRLCFLSKISPELTKIRKLMFNYILYSYFILLFISQILVIVLIVFYLHIRMKGIIGLRCTTGTTYLIH